jgi:hypothetical protein
MMFVANGENSIPMNSPKVVSSRCGVVTHVPGPTAALNVAGSQLSTNATLASLLLTWAVATFVAVTHKPNNTASPVANIANFGISLYLHECVYPGFPLWLPGIRKYTLLSSAAVLDLQSFHNHFTNRGY